MLRRSINYCCPLWATLISIWFNKTSRFRPLRLISEGKVPMFATKLIRWYRMWSRYQHEVNELSRLSDRELADIGVTRSEIAAIAWQDAPRGPAPLDRPRERPPLRRALAFGRLLPSRGRDTHPSHEARSRRRRRPRRGRGRR